MQGRQDPGNDLWDGPSKSATSNFTQRLLSLSPEETGQHRILRNPDEGTSRLQAVKETIAQRTSEMRAIPQRPPTMTRIEIPPTLPRAPRPQQQHISRDALHKRLFIIAGVCVVLAIFASIVGYFFANNIAASTGPEATITDFLQNATSKNYTQAYQDLGPAITIRLSQDQFTRQAKSSDQCYGPIKTFSQVANSAKSQDDGQTYTYDYTITRTELSKSYTMHIIMQKDPDDSSWKVSDYGTDLGPAHPAPACHK